jgi:hypothetical protein
VGGEELLCGVVGSEPPLLASFYPWRWRSGAGPMPLEALLPSEREEVSSFWSLTWVFASESLVLDEMVPGRTHPIIVNKMM